MEKVQLVVALQTVDWHRICMGSNARVEQILAISHWHCQAKAVWMKSQRRAKGLRLYFENRAPPSGHSKADR